MSSKNKAKGTRWESSVRDWFQDRRLKAFRPAQAGAADVGDVHVEGRVVLQCKDVGKSEYSRWIADVREQSSAAGLPFGAVVHKRRQRGTGDAYVVMDLDMFTSMVRRLCVAEDFVFTSPHVRSAYESVMDSFDVTPDVP